MGFKESITTEVYKDVVSPIAKQIDILRRFCYNTNRASKEVIPNEIQEILDLLDLLLWCGDHRQRTGSRFVA